MLSRACNELRVASVCFSALAIIGTTAVTRHVGTHGPDPTNGQRLTVPSHTEIAAPERFFSQNPQLLALCHAINNGEKGEIAQILESGVDLNVTGECGMTVLLWTLVTLHLNYADTLLLYGADPNVPLTRNITYSHYPLEGGETYLTATLKHGILNHFMSALSFSSRPPEPNGYGSTILHLYISCPLTNAPGPPHPMILSDLEKILSTGVDINQRGYFGNTALHYAYYSKPNYVPFLVQRGADPHLANWNGETPAQRTDRLTNNKLDRE